MLNQKGTRYHVQMMSRQLGSDEELTAGEEEEATRQEGCRRQKERAAAIL